MKAEGLKSLMAEEISSPATNQHMSALQSSSPSVLSAAGVRKTYPSGDRTLAVLQGVDFAVLAGETVSIRGESGSGKSTLLNILAADRNSLAGADGEVHALQHGERAVAARIGFAHADGSKD